MQSILLNHMHRNLSLEGEYEFFQLELILDFLQVGIYEPCKLQVHKKAQQMQMEATPWRFQDLSMFDLMLMQKPKNI